MLLSAEETGTSWVLVHPTNHAAVQKGFASEPQLTRNTARKKSPKPLLCPFIVKLTLLNVTKCIASAALGALLGELPSKTDSEEHVQI